MRRLEREAALPVPRMGVGFLVGAGISLLVLASTADGLIWKYSAEREDLRQRVAVTENELEERAEQIRALRRENDALRALHRETLAPEPIGAPDERPALPHHRR